MKRFWSAFLALALLTLACRFTGETKTPTSVPAPGSEFHPQTTRVGDPNVSYANVEFSADMRYMVWFEMTDDKGNGVVWHCGVDAETGDLIPPDGKGFRAFESTVFGRANPGMDADGAYYVGMDRTGKMLLVRPSGETDGRVIELPTPVDPTRRAIYPTVLPGQNLGYVFWMKNEDTPGGGTNPNNAWVELQYISLADPAQVKIVERQERPPRRGFAPMDSAFARWMKGKPALTYGFEDENGDVQVRLFDLTQPNPAPQAVTNDPGDKVDPYSWLYDGREILIPGMDAQARAHVYVRAPGETWFTLAEVIAPPDSRLEKPALAQSHEPILFNGKVYTAYQINEAGTNFWDAAFAQPGEIWLSTVFESPQRQWLLTDSSTPKAEPEPFVGNDKVWVFYNVIEGDDVLTATWHLYRAETPLPDSSAPASSVETVSSPGDAATTSPASPAVEATRVAVVDSDVPIPLDWNSPNTYKGLSLALQDNGAPTVTPVDGVIGLACIGMSNSKMECDAFMDALQSGAFAVNPQVKAVNCAVGSHAIEKWNDPKFDGALWDACIQKKIPAAGLRPDQIRVVWHKAANMYTMGPGRQPLPPYPSLDSDYFNFYESLTTFAERVTEKFPSVQAVYVTSRSYGGFSSSPGRGEPLSYEEGLALNAWLKDHPSVNGVWFGWGPYIWAPDCSAGTTNAEELCYVREDFKEDGTHPAEGALQKIRALLHAWFSTFDWYRP